MLIALQRFMGERPRSNPRLLRHEEAQAARNTKLWSGTLAPWYRPLFQFATVTAGPILSIFRYTSSNYWLHWASDVDVVNSPIADANSRIYFTGDGAPKMTDKGAAIGIRQIAANAPSTQTFIDVDRVRGFRNGDSIRITLNAGTQDVTITTIVDTFTQQRINFTPGLTGAADAGNAVTSLETSYPLDSYPLGIPAPTTAPALAVGGTAGTIAAISSELASVTETDSTSDVDLTTIPVVTGDPIRLIAYTRVTSSTRAVQNVVFEVIIERIDGGTAEIFRQQYDVHIPGRISTRIDPDDPPEYEDASFRWEQTIEVLDRPEVGAAPDYRLTINSPFASPNSINRTKTLTARYDDQILITLGAGDGAKLDVGDRINIRSVEGDPELLPINSNRLEVTFINGDQIAIETDAYGTYTTGGTWDLVHEAEDLEARAYVYTFVANVEGKDMEGPPSPVSAIVDVGEGDQVVVGTGNQLEDPWALSDKHYYTKKRIYRTATGTEDNAEFLFVAEINANVLAYNDTVRGDSLGEVLPSTSWVAPPTDMVGIRELPEGVFVGFRLNEREVCLSEPNQPHAWPIAYRRKTQSPVVGVDTFGATAVLATTGLPHFLQGTTDPLNASMERIESVHPCLSKRGMVDLGYAVVYPGPTGLVLVSLGSVGVVTEHLWTKNEWDKLNPSSFRASRYSDRYFCGYTDTDGNDGAFIFDPREGASELTFLDTIAREVWADPESAELYLVNDDSLGNEQIVQWDSDTTAAPARYRWRSKEYIANRPLMLSVVKVDAPVFPGEEGITVNVYMDGALFDSVTVFNDKPIKLSDELGIGRKWEVEIESSVEVEAVYAASSMRELTRYLSEAA